MNNLSRDIIRRKLMLKQILCKLKYVKNPLKSIK